MVFPVVSNHLSKQNFYANNEKTLHCRLRSCIFDANWILAITVYYTEYREHRYIKARFILGENMLPPSMSIIDSINTNYINIALAKSGVTGCFSKTISRAATAKKIL